jgi:hypothetical protein
MNLPVAAALPAPEAAGRTIGGATGDRKGHCNAQINKVLFGYLVSCLKGHEFTTWALAAWSRNGLECDRNPRQM